MSENKIKTTKLEVIAGGDNGNGTFKGAIAIVDKDKKPLGGVSYYEKPNVQSSTTKETDTSDWDLDSIYNLGNNLILEEEKEEEFFGMKSNVKTFYLIGDLALEKNEDLEELDIKDKIGKINNDISVRSISAYIGTEVIKYMANLIKSEKETDELEISDLDKINNLELEVTLATALPVSAYNKARATELADKFRAKVHKFKILLPKRRKCSISINYKVSVDAEAKATTNFFSNANDILFKKFNKEAEAYNETEEGKKAPRPLLNKEFFTNEDNMIFHTDIGEGTSEMVFTYGNKWKTGISHGIEKGVGRASIEIVNALKDIEGTEHLRSQKMISKVLKERKDRFLGEVVEKAIPELAKQAEEILTDFKRTFNNNVPNLAIVYGGGSILLRDFLEPKMKEICEMKKTPLLYMDEATAVKLNALGLFGYAKSDSFEETILE